MFRWLILVLSGVTFIVHAQMLQSTALFTTAFDVSSMNVEGSMFFATANGDRSVSIHNWTGQALVEIQSISTEGALDVEFFVIGNVSYLGAAHYWTASGQHYIDSKVYKWNGATFVESQSISTGGARRLKVFDIDGITYLVFANDKIKPAVYQWSGLQFELFQDLDCCGAHGVDEIAIDGIHYLGIAFIYADGSYSTDSRIYRWNGTAFEQFQSLRTVGALQMKFFVIDNVTFLAVASFQSSTSSFEIDSKIYQWNGASFEEFQNIGTSGAAGWEHFVSEGTAYLAVANNYDGSSYAVDSAIYRYNVDHVLNIGTAGASNWHAVFVDDRLFLAVANRAGDSVVYQYLPPTVTQTTSSITAIVTTTSTSASSSTRTSTTSTTSTSASSSTRTSTTSMSTSTWSSSTTTSSWTSRTKTSTWTSSMTRTTTTSSIVEGAVALLPGRRWLFSSVGHWSVAALGSYVVMLGLLGGVSMLWKQLRGSADRPTTRATGTSPTTRYGSGAGKPDEHGSEQPVQNPNGVQEPDSEPLESAGVPGRSREAAPEQSVEDREGQQNAEAMSIRQKIRRSPYILALKMVLESTNLVSSMIFTVEVCQRANVMSMGVQCDDDIWLVPTMSRDCPSTDAESNLLPFCDTSVPASSGSSSTGLCEADFEVARGGCEVTGQLDNCGDYDVYRRQSFSCPEIGCTLLLHLLWAGAAVSMCLTVGWTTLFHVGKLWKSPELSKKMLFRCGVPAVLVLLGLLLLLVLAFGFTGTGPTMLAMAVTLSLVPVLDWVMAAVIVASCQEMEEPLLSETPPSSGQSPEERPMLAKSAALDLPVFNILVAAKMDEDHVEKLQEYRKQLDQGLRIFEDIPELVLGVVDLYFFDWSWATAFGLAMSAVMVVFFVVMGGVVTVNDWANRVASMGTTRASSRSASRVVLTPTE